MKLAIVTDTHLSVRNDLEALAEYQNRFWKNVFFPEVSKRGIDQIVHLGDFFDKRQFVTVKSLQNLHDGFLKLIEEYNMHMDLIVGNHDILYRNTVDVNAPVNIFTNNDRINVITEPTEKYGVLMIPWITKSNTESVKNKIETTEAFYCFGHFEISGFQLHKGQICESGMDKDTFQKFHKVLSGHFHTRSKQGNITYVGSPFEMTWNDYNDPRGFHIFDTETGELEFIRFEESMFFKVEYSDDTHFWQPYKPESIEGKFVKVIVKDKNSHYDFDLWLKKLQGYVPSEIQVYESIVDINGIGHAIDDAQNALSNLEIIQNKIASLENTNKNVRAFVSAYMTKLYNDTNTGA